MSIQDLYFVAEQPIQSFDALCAAHDIVLSRRLLARTLAIQILEEWDVATPLDVAIETLPIPHLVDFAQRHNIVIDVYGLKLKLWLTLYQHRADLHIDDSWFDVPQGGIDHDTLDDVLSINCFQDHYEEWMGQSIAHCLALGESITTCHLTPKVDTIALELPMMPDLDEEFEPFAFEDNPELASLVSDVLAGETKPKRSRFLSIFIK